jgi:uncharacterized protein YkwD
MAWTATARRLAITLLAALAVTATLLAATPAEAAGPMLGAESLMVKRINDARASRGLNRLSVNLQMVRIARSWSGTMARQGRLYHRPNLADAVYGPYRRLGENVGVTRLSGATQTELVNRLHRAFMNSDGHRHHILGDYNQFGVGIRQTRDGTMWATINFLKGERGAFPLYRDIDGSDSESRIGRMYYRGVVGGCATERYCPGSTASRRLMAKVLNRATRSHRGSRWLASRCDTRRCKSQGSSRRDAARAFAYVFSLKASSGWFADLTGTDAKLATAVIRAGIMTECSTNRFCPGHNVSRAKLAVLAYRAVT